MIEPILKETNANNDSIFIFTNTREELLHVDNSSLNSSKNGNLEDHPTTQKNEPMNFDIDIPEHRITEHHEMRFADVTTNEIIRSATNATGYAGPSGADPNEWNNFITKHGFASQHLDS
ncbi:hypothetical protein GJ496_011767 [Pomphorhynchus laevis]|nr:hypothetical protein GJ496_011767 [Pomphorhynchus laevis]